MLAGALLGASGACSARLARAPAPLTAAEAGRLLDEAAALAGGIRRYQAVIEVRGEGRDGRFSARLLAVFARPAERVQRTAVDALRLELFAPVGGARWTLVADAERVRLMVPAERAYAEGADLQEFTERLLGVPLGPEQIAALLSGTGTPLTGSERVRALPADGSLVLDGGAALLWDHPASPAQVRRVRTDDYEARYPGDYRRRGRQAPRSIEIEAEGVRATLTVEELEVNAPLHAEAFQLRIPPAYRRAELRELSGATKLPAR